MAKKKIDYKKLANEVAETDSDLDVSSGPSYELPPAGGVLLRFVEYIELGQHPRPAFQGKEKSPADKVRLVFEIVNSKYVKEIEVNGEKKMFAHRISIPMDRILNEKASYYKLFKQMRNGREDITMMAQMLGEDFRGLVVHNQGKDGKTYANLKSEEGAWTIYPPYRAVLDEDGVETGEQKKLAIPEAVGDIRIFMWKRPTQETWDALFIDGDRETTDAKGKTVTTSKNFLQNTIKSALNFEGSPIYELLGGLDSAVDGLDDEEEYDEDGEEYADEEEIDEEEIEEDDSDEGEDDSEEVEEDDEDSEEEELDEDFEEEEEEEPAPKPKKKAAPKKEPAKQVAKKGKAKKSAPPAAAPSKKAARTSPAKNGAKTATKSPSKKRAGSGNERSVLKAMGLL